VFLVNLDTDQVLKPVDWNSNRIDGRGHGGERGLRGVAFHGDRIYIAASEELLVFDRTFRVVATHRNRYLDRCRDACVHGHHLFLASAGCDSILGFNLETDVFDWALRIVTDGMVFRSKPFDPRGEDGPLLVEKLELNSVYCNEGGMYVSGSRTGALLRFDGRAIGVMATLPAGAHDARPFRDGILFNDTQAGAIRFESPGVQVALPVPRFDPGLARQGFGRGLCVLPEGAIAAGSSPATLTLHDLETQRPLKAFNLSLDVRSSIHSIGIWPYEWPERGRNSGGSSRSTGSR